MSLGVFIIWWFQRGLTIEEKTEIGQSFQNANYYLIGLVLVFGIISHVFRTLRWQLLLEPIGKTPAFLNTFLSVMVGYFANLAIPRLGEVVRCTILHKYEKIPVEKSLGTVVTERLMDILLFLILFVLAFLIEYDALKVYVSNTFSMGYSNNILALKNLIFFLVAVIILFSIAYVLYRHYKEKLSKSLFFGKVVKILQGFAKGLLSIKKIKHPGLFVLYSILIWVCYWIMIYLGLQSVREIGDITPSIALVALEMGTIGVMITPGGIGLYPVIISESLSIFGISKTLGYAGGWLSWGSQTLMIIVAGLISMLLLPIINKNKFSKE